MCCLVRDFFLPRWLHLEHVHWDSWFWNYRKYGIQNWIWAYRERLANHSWLTNLLVNDLPSQRQSSSRLREGVRRGDLRRSTLRIGVRTWRDWSRGLDPGKVWFQRWRGLPCAQLRDSKMVDFPVSEVPHHQDKRQGHLHWRLQLLCQAHQRWRGKINLQNLRERLVRDSRNDR